MKDDLKFFGSRYGGYYLLESLIPEKGVVLSGGVGTDMSFSDELHAVRPGLRFVGCDPMREAESFVLVRDLSWFEFRRAAIARPDENGMTRMFLSTGSQSIFPEHRSVLPSQESYLVKAVSLESLIAELSPCVVKLDIEGAEYDCYRALFGVPQIAIEFHHEMIRGRFTLEDTDRAVEDFCSHGYNIESVQHGNQFLFVRNK